MSEAGVRPSGVDALIGRLAGELRPVRRLARPWARAALWLGGAAWLALLLALFVDFGSVAHRLIGAPDMWLAFAGSVLTTALSAAAAFETSVPGRSARWGLLPSPGLALWLGASAAGCLRSAPAGGTIAEGRMHPMLCIYFICLVSLPLCALLTVQIMRACPLRPGLTAALAGLASAGAAASLLTLIHPFDATTIDLAAHAVAVGTVVGLARVIAGRRLGGPAPRP